MQYAHLGRTGLQVRKPRHGGFTHPGSDADRWFQRNSSICFHYLSRMKKETRWAFFNRLWTFSLNEIASCPVFWTILCRKTLVLPLLKPRYKRKSEKNIRQQIVSKFRHEAVYLHD